MKRMAELLVRVIDKINDDPVLNTKCMKRGDVVVVCPDGWGWSKEELTNPFWRIIKMPNLSMEEANRFLAPELDTDPNQPSKTLQRRAFKLDFNILPLTVKADIDSPIRLAEVLEATSIVTADLGMVAKPPILEISIFGLNPRIF